MCGALETLVYAECVVDRPVLRTNVLPSPVFLITVVGKGGRETRQLPRRNGDSRVKLGLSGSARQSQPLFPVVIFNMFLHYRTTL
jgi:hypothetical protein